MATQEAGPVKLLVSGWIRLILDIALENITKEINLISKKFFDYSKYQQFVDGCYFDECHIQFVCTQHFRQLLGVKDSPPIQDIIFSGIVPRLIEFLDSENYDQDLQFEATWALLNIASGTHGQTSFVVRNGAIPPLIKLIGSSKVEIKDQAIWAISNIAGDSPEFRDSVLLHGAMDALLKVIKQFNVISEQNTKELQLQRNSAWILSNFCRGKPLHEWQYIDKIIDALNILNISGDEKVLEYACWAYSYLTYRYTDDYDEDKKIMNKIYSSGALTRLIELLDHESYDVHHPALRAIGNIVTGDEKQTQMVVDTGVLIKFKDKLLNSKPQIMKEVCWTISNITAENGAKIEAVIDANLIPSLIDILRNHKYEIAGEAAWALCNATCGGTDAQISFLVEQDVIGELCLFMKKVKENKVIKVLLEGLLNIIRVGENLITTINGRNQFVIYVEKADGVQILEEIQYNQSLPDDICNLAGELIGYCFDGKSDNVDNTNSTTYDGKIRKCRYCRIRKDAARLYLCKKCRKVRYCGKYCQKKHWPKHRKKCLSV